MKEELKTFVNSVEVLHIWLKNSESSCNAYPLSIQPETTDVSCQFDSMFTYEKDLNLLVCYIKSFVKGVEESEDGELKESFHFNNEFVLVYGTEQFDGNPSKDMLQKFLNTTALFNSIPFHREQVQGQSTKMGIPPVMVPLFKLQSVKQSTVSKKKIAKKITKKKVGKKVVKKLPRKAAKKKVARVVKKK